MNLKVHIRGELKFCYLYNGLFEKLQQPTKTRNNTQWSKGNENELILLFK